jgi:hypothetical protein
MAPWHDWEDYLAGLYHAVHTPENVPLSAAVLRDPEVFREAAMEMVREWPRAADHNLNKMWSGRNAWVGQATCCYVHQATAADTRVAWGTLSNPEQRAANAVADLVRAMWEGGRVHAETLFGH